MDILEELIQIEVAKAAKNAEYQRQFMARLSPEQKEIRARQIAKYRSANREALREKRLARKYELKDKAIEYLGGKCIDCKQSYHPNVYDFHHLDPKIKERGIAQLIKNCATWERLKIEIDKCVLLCSNCHRIRHAKL